METMNGVRMHALVTELTGSGREAVHELDVVSIAD